ncbi:bifunctional helix-turn-helix transcriptional regulator/GNAT family N-acetyltransferase [Curtobacterium sp. MCBD17_021]|uniref:bifunctional helix-turn-helix transcriptional regulator/GNAT family N-acetyltransferase n=1 Tax=Curtobacterium sp. MCBD17_021 TaxID=2175665 RepID=UPI00269EC493|nr:bifunctional helix-turn-helix transcriptional regulator/GNAT family N-acetyltransferase [Curtobacterium sp. MCBD17_021]
MTDDTPWLSREQLRAWMGFVAVMELLPAALDQQLQRDADLTLFDYMVIAMLSERESRTLRMSVLASATNASLPRLSHVVSRLEKRGLVARCPSSEDRRATDVRLTDAGFDHIVAAAPDHVRTARRLVIDALTDEQVAELDTISRVLLTRVDPDGRFAAVSNMPGRDRDDETGPSCDDVVSDTAMCEARLTGTADDSFPGTVDGIGYRAATADDVPLLRRATLDAMNWSGERFADADLDRPEFAHYFDVFDPDRPDGPDLGVVATDDQGPIGVAWAVHLPAEDPGYGFVGEDVPELTLALDARARGRGIGSALLTRLVAAARDAGWPGMSLSVEDGNTGARILYERAGFRTVGRNGDSDTMQLVL